MKKSLKMVTCGCVLMSALATNVYADEVSVADENGLLSCVSSNNTCKLTSDILVSSSINIRKDIVLDLNGYSVTPADTLTQKGVGLFTVIHGGKLTVNDSGDNGTISAGTNQNVYAAVVMTSGEESDETKTATLVVNDGTLEGYYYAISGNGSAGRSNTDVTINGGTLRGINTEDCLGIYHPQDGLLTVNGGTITGTTGIEMRSGELVVTGGTITGTGIPVETQANGSGSTTTGAGIAVAQHTTQKEINVSIEGGTIKGYSALYESDPQNVVEANSDVVSLAITGGTFEAINGGNNAVYSEDVTGFISGGKFNTDATTLSDGTKTNYVSSEVELTKAEEGVYIAAVPNTEYEVIKGNNQTITLGENKEISFTIDIDYELFDKLYLNGKEVSKENYTVKSGSTIITLNSDFAKTLEAGEYEVKVTFTNGSTATTGLKLVSNTPSNTDTKNPKTSDNIIKYFIMTIVSVIGLGFTNMNLYKSKKSHQ